MINNVALSMEFRSSKDHIEQFVLPCLKKLDEAFILTKEGDEAAE